MSVNFSKIEKIFIELVKNQVLLHGNAIKTITIQNIFFNSEELNKIFTPKEIFHMDHLPTLTAEYYFSSIIKNQYNYTELTIVSICIYNNVLLINNLINLVFKAIQNNYGRGKVILDVNNPEEFIKQVMIVQASRNFNPDTIRSNIKTVKIIELINANIMKVFEDNVIVVLPDSYKKIFESNKSKLIDYIIKLSQKTDYDSSDIKEKKNEFKTKNITLHKLIIEYLNSLSTLDINKLFSTIYIDNFTNILPNPKYVSDTYKSKTKDLAKFVKHSDFNFEKITDNIIEEIIKNSSFYSISKKIHKNTALYNFIENFSNID